MLAIKILSILMCVLFASIVQHIGRKMISLKSLRDFIENFNTTKHSVFEQIFFLNFSLFPKMYLSMVDLIGDNISTWFFRAAGYFFLTSAAIALIGGIVLIFIPFS